MLFNSWAFAVFISVVLVCYWALRSPRLQNLFLLGASLFFYGFGGPRFLLLILLCAATAYGSSLWIEHQPERARIALAVGSVVPLGILFVFKYFDFFVASFDAGLAAFGLGVSDTTLSLALPIGISFFTFQSVGYVVDVHRGKVAAERNPVDFLLFVTFFPQLVAGPIERANHLLPQLKSRRSLRDGDIGAGAFLIVQGYLKKVVIADNLRPLVDTVFGESDLSGPLVLVGLLGFTFQIYGDFSGYTDIARGVARLMGFDLLVNFRRPYWSTNPSEFWRRWHITLSNWFRDYVYIALGGNQGGARRTLVNLLLTMVLSGLWHGASANFLLWGAFHGLVLVVHRLWRERRGPAAGGSMRRGLARVSMFAVTVYGWMLFRITSADELWSHTIALVTDPSGASVAWLILVTMLPWIMLAILVDVVESLALPSGAGDPRAPIAVGAWLFLGILIVVTFGAAAGGEFIYFKF